MKGFSEGVQSCWPSSVGSLGSEIPSHLWFWLFPVSCMSAPSTQGCLPGQLSMAPAQLCREPGVSFHFSAKYSSSETVITPAGMKIVPAFSYGHLAAFTFSHYPLAGIGCPPFFQSTLLAFYFIFLKVLHRAQSGRGWGTKPSPQHWERPGHSCCSRRPQAVSKRQHWPLASVLQGLGMDLWALGSCFWGYWRVSVCD
uniref:Uncharacterized protein n=1 Tax=Pongo abelii TaxID=9601 RepID=A0A8I5TSC2_PONAB